jgi:hypothetical protein
VDGSVRRGDGWVEEVRKEDARQRFFLFRYVESHGQVFELSAYSHESIYPHVDDHLRALFDTFKAQSPWPAFTPPDGYASSTVDGTVVWTDTKDKKTLKHVLDAHAATWTAMSKWVSGDRAIADPPIVVVCDKDAVFTELAKLSNAEASPTCFPDFQRRIFVARVGGKTNALLDRMTHDFAALQYLQYFFGGHTPDWVSFGLGKWSMAAFEAKSKPEKATSEFIKLAKDGLAAHPERLDGMLEIRRLTLAPADYDHFDFACYAWHCFFRFGAGAKPYGDRYSKYLADLRKTGSPDEAKKAWDGVDFDAMSAEFRAWVAAWK